MLANNGREGVSKVATTGLDGVSRVATTGVTALTGSTEVLGCGTFTFDVDSGSDGVGWNPHGTNPL